VRDLHVRGCIRIPSLRSYARPYFYPVAIQGLLLRDLILISLLREGLQHLPFRAFGRCLEGVPVVGGVLGESHSACTLPRQVVELKGEVGSRETESE
jgi:hypothetical protein